VVEYGFSVAHGIQREKGYILIPGLRTSHVAPVLNIGMSAPGWVKFLVSYGYHNKFDFENQNQFNDMVFNRDQGIIFQGIKWRIEDPADPVGFGIGITKLNRTGILDTIHPEHNVIDVSAKLKQGLKKEAISSFNLIFNPGVIARVPQRDIISSLNSAVKLRDPYRTTEIISIVLDTIKKALSRRRKDEQNEIAGTIQGFISITRLLEINPTQITQKDPSILLCKDKPGKIPPRLSPSDIAVIIHEFIRNADDGGLPIVLSFMVFDILGANHFDSPEEALWSAELKLPSRLVIEKYLHKVYSKVTNLLKEKGYSAQFSEREFTSICSTEAIRREAVWWEYNLVLARLEALMRDFVGPYRFKVPWSGTFRNEFIRLAKKPAWIKQAGLVLKRTSQLSKNMISNDIYSLAVSEEDLQGWFGEIQTVLSSNAPIDSQLRLLWKFSETIAETDDDPVANFDAQTDTISLLKDPRNSNPYIQRPVVWDWMRRFQRIWSIKNEI
jgi:hypothetical protein